MGDLDENCDEFRALEKGYKKNQQEQTQCRIKLQSLEKRLLHDCNKTINQKDALVSLPILFCSA